MHEQPEFIRLATDFMHAQNHYFALEPLDSERLRSARIRWQGTACALSAFVLQHYGFDAPSLPDQFRFSEND